MTRLFTRLAGVWAISFALLPLVAATGWGGGGYGGNPGGNTPQKNCKKGEFWWKDKECCLPDGGPPAPPKPPKDHDCPPNNYYWSNDKGCCVPTHNPPEQQPPPQCPKNWDWVPGIHACLPHWTPPTPPAPPSQPSSWPGYPGHGKDGKGGWKKRSVDQKSRLSPMCPTGLDACPITGSLVSGEYECLDVSAELESCGGCVSLGQGQDCTTIEGAWNVGCEQGSCAVYTCQAGFVRSHDGKTCVAL